MKQKILGTSKKPRLSVFRSNRFVYAQIIDDQSGKTLLGVSQKHLKDLKKVGKIELAKEVGTLLAKKAIEKKIKTVVFDKGRYAYHGVVQALADGAREGGLKF